ncbi:MAG: hypothetical protein AB7G15_16585 [Alphaproteobacteria bacterium]
MAAQNKAVTAQDVKQLARNLGAHLVGIAGAGTLNRFPPDPKWPQTPDRVAPDAKSVIVLGFRVPVAAFRCQSQHVYSYLNLRVLRRADRTAKTIADRLEALGHPCTVTPSNSTVWEIKYGTYGHLSLRHLAVEAGLGTLGLEINLLTPEYGPRVNFAAIVTELELEPDKPMTEQVCIGESCSRCVYACPTDAVRHFGLDKRACATAAQITGFPNFMTQCMKMARGGRAVQEAYVNSQNFYQFWRGWTGVTGSYGTCPRCEAVCPVGNDYHLHLADAQKTIPETTPAKLEKAKRFQAARKGGEPVDGLNEWNRRWVGPEGYKGIVARQLQDFKKRQRVSAEAAPAEPANPGASPRKS